MFWMVNRIAQFAYLRYNQIGAEVREVIDAHENAMIELIAKTDEEACGILAKSEKKAV
jgi:hypothetical protein